MLTRCIRITITISISNKSFLILPFLNGVFMNKKSTLSLTILALCGVISFANAAVVPEGVELAEKQVLVRGNGDEIQGLDPHKVEGVPERNVLNDLIEGLVITDPKGNLIPAGATHWESADNQTWTFHLREGAKWSNGDPVTAHDYVFAWRRIATPETASPYSSFLQYAHIENIDDIIAGKAQPETLGVKAVDDLTLEVKLSTPVSYFPKMLYHYSLAPVNPKAIQQHGDKWTQPGNFVSNGAYNLKDWVVNEKIVLERNPMYWDDANTVINQVSYIPVQEINEMQRYRADEIDMTYTNMPIELFKKLKSELPDELKTGPLLCSYYFEINNKKAPLTDVRVREALKIGMDQKTMVEKVLGQGQLPAYGYTPPAVDGAQLPPFDWFNESQDSRNQRAKALLAEAGYDESKPLKIQLLYNTSDLHKKLAVAASQMWKKNIGVEVELVNTEWKTFLDTRHAGNFDISRAGWCADYNEASAFLNTMKSDSSNNTSHYVNPKFDELLKQAITTQDDKARSQVYADAEALLNKDSVLIPLFYYVNNRMVKPYVGGYTALEPLDNIYVKDLYIIKH